MHLKKTPTQIEHRHVDLCEVKLAGETEGTFNGYGAVFNNVDSYGDVIAPGAFAETLSEWKGRGKFPPMLLQHGGMGIGVDDMLPVGEWTHMEENSRGLKMSGRLFALNTERGQYIYEGLKSGVLDGLSIGFMVKESINGTKPNEPARKLTKIDLWEVSIVTFPANPKARVTGVKNMTPDELRELEAALRDEGLSRTDAVRAVSGFKKWCQSDSGAPESEHCDDVSPDVLAEALKLADSMFAASLNR